MVVTARTRTKPKCRSRTARPTFSACSCVSTTSGVELAKRFGATDGYRYVNAVLDRASRAHRGAERGEVA